MATKKHSSQKTIEVATKKGDAISTETESLDVNDLSKVDLKSLFKRDAFMYYSIPGIHRATLVGKRIDYSDKNALLGGAGHARPPADDQPNPKRSKSTVVPRRSRISYETDLITLMITDGMEDEATDEDN